MAKKKIISVTVPLLLALLALWQSPVIVCAILEKELSKHLERTVKIKSISVDSVHPFSLSLNKIHTSYSDIDIEVDQARLIFKKIPTAFEIQIKQAEIRKDSQIIPFQIQSEIQIDHDKVEFVKNQFIILNINTAFSGTYELDSRTAHFTLSYNTQDKDKKNEIENFPIKEWQGFFGYSIDIQKKYKKPAEISAYIKLEDVKAKIDWRKTNTEINGDIKASLETTFRYTDHLTVDSLAWDVDATKLGIDYNRIFKKPSDIKLVSRGYGEKKNKFYLKNFNLEFLTFVAMAESELTSDGAVKASLAILPFSFNGYEIYFPFLSDQPLTGNMELNGRFEQFADSRDKFNLNIETLKLNDFQAKLKYNEDNLKIHGPVSGDLSVTAKGMIDIANWLESDATIVGSLNANLPEVFYRTQGHIPFSFLPKTKLFENLKLNSKVNIEGLQIDQVALRLLTMSSNLSLGKIKLEGEINEAFSGRILLKEAQIPMLEENPTIKISSNFSNINMETFLGALFPKWKDLAIGEFTGDVAATTLLPSSPDFFNSLKAKGQFTLQNGLLQNLHFDQLVKSALSKLTRIKGVTQKAPQKMQMMGAFSLLDGVLKLSQFIAATTTREEFNFEGLLDLNMNLNMTGKAFLYGRSAIPVTLTGHILSPDLSLGKVAHQDIEEPSAVPPRRQPAEAKKPSLPPQNKSPDDEEEIKDLFGR
jgi:hypothetical protein